MAESAEYKALMSSCVCPICYETITTPKALPCLHTFCQHCISQHITTAFNNQERNNYISCPVCKQRSLGPSRNSTVSEFVASLPVNFYVNNLLETLQKLKNKAPKTCSFCSQQGKQEPALFACEGCDNAFCNSCSLHHETSAVCRDRRVKMIGNAESENVQNKCSQHKSEEIKFFCVDHTVACCIMCINVTHRKCSEVETIEDHAKAYNSKHVVSNIERGLDDLMSDVNTLITFHQDSRKNIDVTSQMLYKSIETFFSDLIIKITELTDQVVESLRENTEAAIGLNTCLEKQLDGLKKQILGDIQLIKLVKNDEVQVLIKSSQLIENCQNYSKTVHNHKQERITLEYNQSINPENILSLIRENMSICCGSEPASLTLKSDVIHIYD